MKNYRISFNVELWVSDLEIEAQNERDAENQLLELSNDELLNKLYESGSVNDSCITSLDVTIDRDYDLEDLEDFIEELELDEEEIKEAENERELKNANQCLEYDRSDLISWIKGKKKEFGFISSNAEDLINSIFDEIDLEEETELKAKVLKYVKNEKF